MRFDPAADALTKLGIAEPLQICYEGLPRSSRASVDHEPPLYPRCRPSIYPSALDWLRLNQSPYTAWRGIEVSSTLLQPVCPRFQITRECGPRALNGIVGPLVWDVLGITLARAKSNATFTKKFKFAWYH